MCHPLAYAALAIGGAGYSNYLNQKAIKAGSDERSGYLQNAINTQNSQQGVIDNLVNNQLPQYTPESVQGRIGDQAAGVEGSILDAIYSQQADIGNPRDAGDVSSAYERLMAKTVANNQADAVDLAKRYAAITAPNLVNIRDAAARGETGWDIQSAMDIINRNNEYSKNASQLVFTQPNRVGSFLGQGAQIVGQIGAMGGFGGGSPGATVTTSQPAVAGSAGPMHTQTFSGGGFRPWPG